jgi:hypothetical protein
MVYSLGIKNVPEKAEDSVHVWGCRIFPGWKSDLSSDMKDEKNLPGFFEEVLRTSSLPRGSDEPLGKPRPGFEPGCS